MIDKGPAKTPPKNIAPTIVEGWIKQAADLVTRMRHLAADTVGEGWYSHDLIEACKGMEHLQANFEQYLMANHARKPQ